MPNDGGLGMPKEAYRLNSEFHKEFEGKIHAWTNEWFCFMENGMTWLANVCRSRVCPQPGDLVAWDSPVPHYDLRSFSTTSQNRFMYTPAIRVLKV